MPQFHSERNNWTTVQEREKKKSKNAKDGIRISHEVKQDVKRKEEKTGGYGRT